LAFGERWIGPKVLVFQGTCGDWPAGFEARPETHFPTGPDDPSWSKYGNLEGGNFAQLAFLDGHVTTIAYEVSRDILRAISIGADGRVVDESIW
jgi:prepilin-type processing-associated H-X9-DG protein